MRIPDVLVDSPAFRWLWASRVVSFTGDGVANLALVLLAADLYGPPGVSIMLLAQSLPRFLGPLAGAIVDRVEQRGLMLVCELGQAILVATIALATPPFAVTLALVAAMSALVALFAPAGRSAVPALVAPDQRLSANALLGLAFNLEVALGGLLGGALVAAVGVQAALLADAASFVGSALLLSRVPRLPPQPDARAEGLARAVAGGVAYARRDPLVRTLVLATVALVMLAGVDNVAIVFVARDVLGGGPGTFGLLVAVFGAGMIAASAVLALRRASADPMRLTVVGFAATGAGLVITGLARVLPVAAVGQAVGGAANGIENIAADTLIQERVPRHLLGRVFGLMNMGAQVGQVVALGLAAGMLAVMGPGTAMLVAGVATLGLSVVLALVLRRMVVTGGSPHPR